MGTASRTVRCTLHTLITPAQDVPGLWVAHCLELDVISQGNDPEHALRAIAEAVEMVVEDDLERGDDPLEVRTRAPEECWITLLRVMQTGQPVDLSELGNRRIEVLVVELNLFRPRHPGMNVDEPERLLAPHVARAQYIDRPSVAC